MADFAAHNSIEDWSLQAIVRGPSGDFTKVVMDGCDSSFGTNDQLYLHNNLDDRDFFASFPELFFDACNNSGSCHDLEDLYKPFYPVNENNYASDIHHQSNTVAAQLQRKSIDDDVITNNNNAVEEHQINKTHEVASDQSSSVSENCVVTGDIDGSYTPKYKRSSRKNQHKRVVIQVPAEGLSSDMWAWRKYGQKPIKGSPYPRSYYRCSSSKGCLARKQVEESYTEPGMFIITYTAEHSHSKPTRRNSLAGTVRQKKFPSNKRDKLIQAAGSSRKSSPPKAQVTSNRDAVFSPHYQRARVIKREGQGDEHGCDDNHTMENNGGDLMFINEDFFSGLEDFDDFISASVRRTLAHQTLPVRSS